MYKSAPTKINPQQRVRQPTRDFDRPNGCLTTKAPKQGFSSFSSTKQNMAHFVSGTQTDLLARDLGKSYF